MGYGSGLGASIGISDETTPGVFNVATIRHYRASKFNIKPRKNPVEPDSFAAGQPVAAGVSRVVPTRDAAGSLELPVTTAKMGLLLKHIFGGAVTPVQQLATTAYLQTHVLVDRAGRSCTAQQGLPRRGGIVTPVSGFGGKILSAEFSCSRDNPLMLTVEFDFKDSTRSQALASVTYVAQGTPFHFGQLGIKMGTVGAEVAVPGVKSTSLKIEFPSDVEAYYANAAGLKDEQIQNGLVSISGSMETDYINDTDFYDRFVADSSVSLVQEWIGSVIAGAYSQTLRFKTPQIFIDDEPPEVEGGGIAAGAWSWSGRYDLTNAPITCEYISTDTTL